MKATGQVLRYYVSAKSSNLRHWTIRAVVWDGYKEISPEKVYFKGTKRDCKLKASVLNRMLQFVS